MSALHPIATELLQRKGRTRGLPCCSVQQLRQFGEVRRHPPRFVPGEQINRRALTWLVLEIEIAERLPRAVADDEAGVYSPP